MNLKSVSLLLILCSIHNFNTTMDHTPLSAKQKQAIKDELISVTITSNFKQFQFTTKSNSMPTNSESLNNCIASCCFFAQNYIGETKTITDFEQIKKLPREVRKEIANQIIYQQSRARISQKMDREDKIK
ncbi:MAG: hypothetical protein ACXWL2_01120 [Candidatus Chromulinivorax sp.]